MVNVAIFASGNGSNAENIISYFKNSKYISIKLILSNNADSYVLQRASNNKISYFTFTSSELKNSNLVLDKLNEFNIDFIVLAGFLLMVPESILKPFRNKIINIHPALLPKYGGKGMYGDKVHNAVINSKEKESGITIHYVNEKYDDGEIIFQALVNINESDTSYTLAEKIHTLEYKYYPEIINKIITDENTRR